MRTLSVIVMIVLAAGLAVQAHVASRDGLWMLTEVGGKAVTSRAYFEIHGSAISGFDGCNRFQGRLDVANGIMVGRTPCFAGAIILPLSLKDLPALLGRASMTGNILRLPAAGPNPASAYRRAGA